MGLPSISKLAIIKWVIAALALFGAYAAFDISRLHITGAKDCPTIAFIPACYVVLAGYFAMVVAILRPSKWLFIIGLLPVLGLASMGVIAELMSNDPVCPRTSGGIPQCYFSFIMSATLGVLGIILFRANKA